MMTRLLIVLCMTSFCYMPALAQTGSCCHMGGCDEDVTEDYCDALGGDWTEGGTCFEDCNQGPPLGACCYDMDNCEDYRYEDECDVLGGNWFEGATCDEVCGGEGSCCYEYYCEEGVSEFECVDMGGIWIPDGTCEEDCIYGRCCYGDPNDPFCDEVREDVCAQLNGIWEAGEPCFLDACVPCPYPSLDIEPDNDNFGEFLPAVSCGDTLCGAAQLVSDYYRIVVPDGQYLTMTIDCFGNDTPGMYTYGMGSDPRLRFIDADGVFITQNFSNGGPPGPVGNDSRIVTPILAPGTYYIEVANQFDPFGAYVPYILTIDCAISPVGRCCYIDPANGSLVCDDSNNELYCSTLGGDFIVGATCATDPCEEECVPEPGQAVFDPEDGLPQFQCLYICPGDSTLIIVGPGLGPTQEPVMAFISGCILNDYCSEPNCPPAIPLVAEWYYNASLGTWFNHVRATPGTSPGCICVVLDDYLAVELTSFDAIPGDQAVTLLWQTASEIDNDHFSIARDGTVVGRVNANGSATGASYEWTEHGLTNGTEYTYSVSSVDVSGIAEEIFTISAAPSFNTATITEFALHQNYPNPFNPGTSITFDLVESSAVSLTVFNPLGQTVATLVDGPLAAGRHTQTFDAANLPSGLYFYRLTAGDFTAIRKMVLMK